MGRRLCVGCVLVVAFLVGPSHGRCEETTSTEIRVMSFNIRYGTAKDGENHWDRRKDFLVETILAFQPDLLGTQETLAMQRDFLKDKLPAYECLGVGREDGAEKGGR